MVINDNQVWINVMEQQTGTIHTCTAKIKPHTVVAVQSVSEQQAPNSFLIQIY